MNAHDIADPTVPDYEECLAHLNRVLCMAWLANEPSGWSDQMQSVIVWGSSPLVKLRSFFFIVVPNVHAIVGQLIGRLIITQKPAVCTFISSLAVVGFTMHVIEWKYYFEH